MLHFHRVQAFPDGIEETANFANYAHISSGRIIRAAMRAAFRVTAKVKCFNCSDEELITERIEAADESSAEKKFRETAFLCEKCNEAGTKCVLRIIEPPPLTITPVPIGF